MTNTLLSSIDYLSGVGKFNSLKNAEEFIDDLAGLLIIKDEPYIENKPVRIGQLYQMSVKSAYKMYGGLKSTIDDRWEMTIQLPGEFCRGMKNQQEGLETFCSELRATRIDCALDDRKRRISQSAVNTIGIKGDYVGVDSYKLMASKGSQEQEEILTCYFGSANKSLRFYNAEAVHGFDADRWEATFRGEYAEQAVYSILEKPEDFSITLGSLVTGAIDFVERGGNWDYQPRYIFWQSLRDELGQIKLTAPKQEYSIAKSLAWIEHQIEPTLAMLYEGLGRQAYLNFMEKSATRGIPKLKPHHNAIIANLKNSEIKLWS